MRMIVRTALLLLLVQIAASQATTILLPDGTSAAGAKAASLAVEYFAHVTGIEFARPTKPVLVADDGTLEVTSKTSGRWIILHPDGWADAELSPNTSELRLTPWQEIRGTIETSLSSDAVVSYYRTERPIRQGERGSVFGTSTATVGSDGTFTMAHVPTGHGSVGIRREAKSERRILKWRDYPQLVEVPQNKPLHLGGGVTVGGRIVSGKLPAVLSLSSTSVAPSYNTLTEDDGSFAIPGVLPGEYWLTARPDLGQATRNIPQRKFVVGTESIDLGDLANADHDVEIDGRVEMFEGLLDRVRATAVAEFAIPVEKIWIGELGHPSGQYGAPSPSWRAPIPRTPPAPHKPSCYWIFPVKLFGNITPRTIHLVGASASAMRRLEKPEPLNVSCAFFHWQAAPSTCRWMRVLTTQTR
jgi:hypothetical protein